MVFSQKATYPLKSFLDFAPEIKQNIENPVTNDA